VAWAEAYLRTKWHPYASSRFATLHGPKIGALLFPLFGEREVKAYRRTKWHLDPSSRLAITDMGNNLRGCAHLTVWPESRPTSMPSLILIHQTVWPQYTNATDRQGGQDNTGQRSPNKRQCETGIVTIVINDKSQGTVVARHIRFYMIFNDFTLLQIQC